MQQRAIAALKEILYVRERGREGGEGGSERERERERERETDGSWN